MSQKPTRPSLVPCLFCTPDFTSGTVGVWVLSPFLSITNLPIPFYTPTTVQSGFDLPGVTAVVLVALLVISDPLLWLVTITHF